MQYINPEVIRDELVTQGSDAVAEYLNNPGSVEEQARVVLFGFALVELAQASRRRPSDAPTEWLPGARALFTEASGAKQLLRLKFFDPHQQQVARQIAFDKMLEVATPARLVYSQNGLAFAQYVATGAITIPTAVSVS
jgi:hypothetical protein